MAIHFVADLNFDGNSARHAHPHGFADSREMVRRICEVWRSRVRPDDLVWILGNVGNPVHLADLPGTKHLAAGGWTRPRGTASAPAATPVYATAEYWKRTRAPSS